MHNKKLYEILFLIGSTLFLSLYFALLTNAIFAGQGISVNPITLIKCCFEYGFPFGPFLLFMLLIGGILAMAYKKIKDSAPNIDPYSNFEHAKTSSYGSARWAKEDELKGFAELSIPSNVYGPILGTYKDNTNKVIALSPENQNQHIAIIGDSGSGKSFCFSRNSCFQAVKRRESVILTDPSGELYNSMSNYFRDEGYVVKVLNLIDTSKSNGWNCLKEVSHGPQGIDIFANAIIQNTQGVDKHDFWTLGELSLLKAIALRTAYDPTMEQNMGGMYDLLIDSGGIENLIATFARTPLEAQIALGPFNTFSIGGEKVTPGMMMGLATRLNFLLTPAIRTFLSIDDIDLSLPGQKPCAYFCIIPSETNALRPISSMFFSFLFTNLVDQAQKNGGRLKVPVNFLLDELPNIGKIPGLEEEIATIRKYGMNATLIFQSIPQLREAYTSRDIVSAILSNCGTMVSYGTSDPETLEYLSNMTGECTTKMTRINKPEVLGMTRINGSVSYSEGKRMLMTPHDIRTMPRNECLIIFKSLNAVRGLKFGYINHPDYSLLRPTNFFDMPTLSINNHAEDKSDELLLKLDDIEITPKPQTIKQASKTSLPTRK